VRKKWLVLPLGAALTALAVGAFLVWCVAKDARQSALLDARVRAADDRVEQALHRRGRLVRDGAPRREVAQAYQEEDEAWEEYQTLRTEQEQRQQPWHSRLREEVRRRTGL
jgi:hypothetical protein